MRSLDLFYCGHPVGPLSAVRQPWRPSGSMWRAKTILAGIRGCCCCSPCCRWRLLQPGKTNTTPGLVWAAVQTSVCLQLETRPSWPRSSERPCSAAHSSRQLPGLLWASLAASKTHLASTCTVLLLCHRLAPTQMLVLGAGFIAGGKRNQRGFFRPTHLSALTPGWASGHLSANETSDISSSFPQYVPVSSAKRNTAGHGQIACNEKEARVKKGTWGRTFCFCSWRHNSYWRHYYSHFSVSLPDSKCENFLSKTELPGGHVLSHFS